MGVIIYPTLTFSEKKKKVNLNELKKKKKRNKLDDKIQGDALLDWTRKI